MDVSKLLRNINSLNDYIAVTQDLASRHEETKIQFNMSTVLSLKKIRSLEIEYFNKYDSSGAAFIIFERILLLPPFKSWGLLGKELVTLLQYWLDALRKHLISHNAHWWIFLRPLLKFIKETRLKDPALNSVIVEETSESLLDLATNSIAESSHKYEILHCFNLCCADCSREVRLALRMKLDAYFIKLSSIISSCGNAALQCAGLETLLRWLLPRQDATVRKNAAVKWFPNNLYERPAVDIFLERPWMNFFQDARDFLNAQNEGSDRVTSVVCKRLAVGDIVIISGEERRENWLDVNSASKCVSILLEPRLLEAYGVDHTSCENLIISQQDVLRATLAKNPRLVITLSSSQSPLLCPSSIKVGNDGDDVTITVSSRSDVVKLDKALRAAFEDKYQTSMSLDNVSDLQDDMGKKICNSSEEESRFSHPVEVTRRKRSGYIVKQRDPMSCVSPSTASTTSLAQLHDKLAALPRYRFDKEPVSICAQPELSSVTEVSETDERYSFNTTSTYKLRQFGVYRSYKSTKNDAKSQSDGERDKNKPKITRHMSPVINHNEPTISCLLDATIGSDESIINDTLERFHNKNINTDNLVDLLVKEALEARNEKEGDSGINTGDKKTQEIDSEVVENTQVPEENVPKCTVISNSTTDESNTEVIAETPSYVNVRRKIPKRRKSSLPVIDENKENIENEKQIFDAQAVENFFSQHFRENKAGNVVVSPTLAKKINETSSEHSDDLEDLIIDNNFSERIGFEFNDIEILECLNSMVDKVCSDFEKYTEQFLGTEGNITEPNVAENDYGESSNNADNNDKKPLQDLSNTKDLSADNATVKQTPKGLKLKYNKAKPKKQTNPKAPKKGKNKVVETTKKLSAIEEVTAEDSAPEKKTGPEPTKLESPTNFNESDGPLMRRKRKLYSPKDNQIENEKRNTPVLSDEDDVVLADFKTNIKTPNSTKTTATPYKELERDRKTYIRQPRSRKSRAKTVELPSPRTKKMNELFDKVKDTDIGSEKITFADKIGGERDLAIYNFTSDSEDEDFKKKKIELQKRTSTTTIGSVDSMKSKHGRLVKKANYSENVTSDEGNKKTIKRKKVYKRTRKIKVEKNITQNDLIDERMREKAPEVELNTSMIAEAPNNDEVKQPEPQLKVIPQMEAIEDNTGEETETSVSKNIRRKRDKLSLKREKGKPKSSSDTPVNVDDRTESPLPGLLVETVNKYNDDPNDSVSANMIHKFKRIYQEGPEVFLNTSQNLPSDVEKINYSPHNFNITDELREIADNSIHNSTSNDCAKASMTKVQVKKEKGKGKNTRKENKTEQQSKVNSENEINSVKQSKTMKKSRNSPQPSTSKDATFNELLFEYNRPTNIKPTTVKPNKNKETAEKPKKVQSKKVESITSEDNEIINISGVTKSVKSIATVGNSPITAHGDFEEAPPSFELLKQKLIPRDLELEDMDQSMQEYFIKLRNVHENFDKPTNLGTKNEINDAAESKNSSRSPIVSVARLSFDDIAKWLPSRRTSDTDSTASRKTVKSKIDSPKTNKNEQIKKVERKSQISPINIFLDLPTVQHNNSSDDENDTKEPKQKEIERPVHNETKKYNLRVTKIKNIKDTISTKTSRSNVSASARSRDVKIPEKRRSPSIDREVKRRKVDDNEYIVMSESGPSTSSVNDWFRRNMPSCSTGETERNQSLPYKDIIENVMEKLDTTLVEINQNTSKKFIHMFVDTQKELKKLEEERRVMYKQTASEMLAAVYKMVDDKFAYLNQRSQELDAEFMESLKKRACDLIREDCKQKRAMVLLLREDVQAVLEHLDKQRNDM